MKVRFFETIDRGVERIERELPTITMSHIPRIGEYVYFFNTSKEYLVTKVTYDLIEDTVIINIKQA